MKSVKNVKSVRREAKIERNFVIAVLIIFLAAFAVPQLSAAEKKTSRGITLNGVVGDVLDVSVSPIAASSDTDVTGMPFSITDSTVRPFATDVDGMSFYHPENYGRVIGTWTLLSNCDFTITVEAEPMYHTDDRNIGTLGYMLFFDANVQYVDSSGHNRTATGMVVAQSGHATETRIIWPGSGAFTTNKFSDYLADADFTAYAGVINGNVAFCFTEDGWTKANSETTPPGYYRANATIIVESTL